jgi:hypothetical protein
MSDPTEVYEGIRAKLAASSAVTDKVGQRIYKKTQPAHVDAFPYISYYISGGGYENICPDDLLNITMMIEAWALTDKEARQAFEAARAAIHKQTLSVDGWRNFWCMAETIHDLPPEIFEGKQYFRAGADFRIRLEGI